jgi:hypothetical protein
VKERLASYPAVVVGVASVDHRVREGIEQYKAKLLLADGSSLHVSEVWVDGQLTKYSYYWLDESDHLIAGWDNAPHHPEIKSHPHHMHAAKEVRDSTLRDLDDVLTFLTKRILGE